MVDRIEIKPEMTGPEAPSDITPQTSEPTPVENRPNWLPEKFESPEALAKAYSELEKRFTQQSQAENIPENPDVVKTMVENAGLNMSDLTAEYQQTGQLSDTSYDKLDKAGVGRVYVDGYIRGQEALALQYQSEVLNIAGGQAQYAGLVQWAAQNLGAEEIEAYNQSVNSGNLQQARLAVQGLAARFMESEGKEPALLRGGASPGDSVVFRSVNELTQAMADPRYKTDPAYRQDVIHRLSRSSVL